MLKKKHGRVKKSPPIRCLSDDEANSMLEKWHYLGEVRSIIAAYGHDEGCCVFTNPRSRYLQKNSRKKTKIELARPANKIIELARMVGKPNHEWAMTSLMAQCLKRVQRLGYERIITYADPYNQNDGTVYRAGNWKYVGESVPSVIFILDGKRVSSKGMYDKHGTQSRSVMKRIYGDRIQFEYGPPKPRYIYDLKPKRSNKKEGLGLV